MFDGDKRNLLARHMLFRGLAPGVLDGIIGMSVTKTFTDGTVVFLRGDSGTGLYGVLTGRIKISINSSTGKELILGFMEPGDVFGEVALFDGKPRTANAIAMGQSRLLMIPHSRFVPFLEQHPELCLYFLNLLCGRLRSTNQRVEDSAFLGLPARLAKRLLDMAQPSGPEGDGRDFLIPHLSQQALGQILGASRESVNKQLQIWRKQGWIELDRRQVVIRNPTALERIAMG